MGLGLLKRKLPVFCGILLLGVSMPSIGIWAKEPSYPMFYEKPKGEGDVMELQEAEGEYTVQPGDSLWSIADRLWGDGSEYKSLFLANKEMVSAPGIIYPGMVLKMERTGYIARTGAGHGGAQMGKYSMDTPYGWTVGVLSSGDAFANYVFSGGGIKSVACLIQDKKKETGEAVADWEKYRQKVQKYAKENYADSVSGLSFSHYRMGNGEVYLYSYTYRVSLEDYGMSGSTSLEVCAGMKLTGNIQAEFVGFASDYDIEGCVRYMAASFEEHSDAYSPEEFTVNDSNMSITPETEWEAGGMFNSFAWVDEFFTSLVRKASGVETDKRQALVGRMSRRAEQGVSYGN